MTNPDQPDEKPASAQDWLAQANAYAARKQEIHPENQAAIFDALERCVIQIIALSFDGYGDSGQIDEVSITAGEPNDLHAIEIEQKKAVWGNDTIETVAVPLHRAIEELSYALLERTHCGWEINEGGFGEFVFDVATRTITLEFSERYVSHESYSHEF